MKIRILLALTVCLATLTASAISLTTFGSAYTQNFDTLASSGTSSAVPAGWAFAESGGNANNTYTAGTGSDNTGDTYSFGASGSGERAFGGLLSGSLTPTFGAFFSNDTGDAINFLDIVYIGEQWRLGTAGRADRLNFQYSTDAESLATGIWTDVDALDFTTPNTVAPTGSKDGNAAENRTAIASTISDLNIVAGASFWIRWTDLNVSGADDGLAVDDFSLTARRIPRTSTVPETLPSGFAAAALLVVLGLGHQFGRFSLRTARLDSSQGLSGIRRPGPGGTL